MNRQSEAVTRCVEIGDEWYDIPNVAEYIAQDENGDWFWYEEEPYLCGEDCWDGEERLCFLIRTAPPEDFTKELYELGDSSEEESAPKPLVFKIVEDGTAEERGEVHFSLEHINNNRIVLKANGWRLLDITPKGVERICCVSHDIGIAVDSVSRIVLDE